MTEEESEDIESFAPPPASPTRFQALTGAVHHRTMQLAGGLGEILPESVRSAGQRAMKALDDRRRATIDHAISSQERRCKRIKEIEVHVEAKFKSLEANEEGLRSDLEVLRKLSKETAELLEGSVKETQRFQNRLERVRKEYVECRRHIDVLEASHIEKATEKATQKAREEAAKRAREEFARAKKRAKI